MERVEFRIRSERSCRSPAPHGASERSSRSSIVNEQTASHSTTETALQKSRKPGGADRARTDNLRLAKPALCQLSYSPAGATPLVGPGRLELPTSRLSVVCSSQLSYRPVDSKSTATRWARSLKAEQQVRRSRGIDRISVELRRARAGSP